MYSLQIFNNLIGTFYIMSYAASSSNNDHGSGYRLKFKKLEFLKLLEIAEPRIIYRVANFYYFNFDGFTMYCDQVNELDMSRFKIIRAIEFSNIQWSKTKNYDD